MALQDPSTYTVADLANPTLDDVTLRHIAQYRPDLRGFILQHPACSPALAQMIHASNAPQQAPAAPSVPSVPQAPAGFDLRQASAPPAAQAFAGQAQQFGQQQFAQAQHFGEPQQFAQPQTPQHPQAIAWAQWIQQTTGRQPAPTDYQNAVAAGHLPHDVLMGMPSSSVTYSAGIPAQLGGLGKFLLLLPLGAIIAIISTFLPFATIEWLGTGLTVTWIQGGDGAIILVSVFVVIAVAVLAIVKPATWSYIVAGIVGILAHNVLFFMAIVAFATIADLDATLGVAPFVLLLGAFFVEAGAVIALISVRKL